MMDPDELRELYREIDRLFTRAIERAWVLGMIEGVQIRAERDRATRPRHLHAVPPIEAVTP